MSTYFITGTDTDCGKTYVTGELLRYCRTYQNGARAVKPVASGCYQDNGHLRSEDADYLGSECRWTLTEPISPHLAAKADKVMLSAAEIADFCQSVSAQNTDTLFIEGAGGLLVPLNDEETWVDVLKQTQIPVIIVVGMRLGCINHALLTVSALEKNEIPCAGWIANCFDEKMLYLEENIITLVAKISSPLLGRVAYGGAFEPHQVVAANKSYF